MQTFIVIGIVLLGVITPSLSRAEDFNPSPRLVSHYRDLDCLPYVCSRYEYYDCGVLSTQDPTKCYINRQVYEESAKINQSLFGICDVDPICTKGTVQTARIKCPDDDKPRNETAICEEVHDQCCKRDVCGPEEIGKLHVCYMDGKKYFGGERMHAEKKECFCDDKWDNATAIHMNKNCRDKICISVFKDVHEYRRNCAPIYHLSNPDCPVGVKCPEATDKIVKAEAPPPDSAPYKCKYGDMELNLFDRVEVKRLKSGDTLECRCSIPSLVTCIIKHRSAGSTRKNRSATSRVAESI